MASWHTSSRPAMRSSPRAACCISGCATELDAGRQQAGLLSQNGVLLLFRRICLQPACYMQQPHRRSRSSSPGFKIRIEVALTAARLVAK